VTLDPRDPLDADDVAVLAALRTMYAAADPAPDLVDRVLFALDLDRIDIELAAITAEYSGATGSRSAENTRTVTFESSSLRITVSVPEGGSRYLDGWIEPAAELQIELITPTARFGTRSDEGGRFAFASVPTGQVHLEILPTAGSAVRLTRRVVTQRLVL